MTRQAALARLGRRRPAVGSSFFLLCGHGAGAEGGEVPPSRGAVSPKREAGWPGRTHVSYYCLAGIPGSRSGASWPVLPVWAAEDAKAAAKTVGRVHKRDQKTITNHHDVLTANWQ